MFSFIYILFNFLDLKETSLYMLSYLAILALRCIKSNWYNRLGELSSNCHYNDLL